MRVILLALYHVDEIIDDTLESLAHKIRCSEITIELTAIEDREPSQYKARLEASYENDGRRGDGLKFSVS
jgi:hypothetical protein